MPERWGRVLAGLLALALLPCGAGAQALQVRDDQQQPVHLPAPAHRVVSLLPALSETVCALQACGRLVGVDRHTNWPQALAPLPRVGGGIDPQIERIVALRPDLVLAAGSARGLERLQAVGIPVLRIEPRTHADVQRSLHTVAQALGLEPARADAAWLAIDQALQRAAQTVPTAARGRSVYFEVSPAPYGAAPSSFVGQTLQRLGLHNVLGDEGGPFPLVSPERVVRAQPDVLMAADSSRQAMLDRPGWSRLAAVQAKRLCVFGGADADALVRPGPRMGEGAQRVAQCLQGLWGAP